MRRLDQPGKLVGGDERNLRRPSARDDNRLAIRGRAVAQSGQVGSGPCVRRLNGRRPPSNTILYRNMVQVPTRGVNGGARTRDLQSTSAAGPSPAGRRFRSFLLILHQERHSLKL